MLSDALLRPDRFFRNRTTDPRVVAPFAIVLLLVAMRSAVALALPFLADGRGREPLASAGILNGLSRVPVTLAVLLVSWGLYALTFHVIATRFGGDGDLATTFTLAGWGFLPLLLSPLVTAGLIVVVLGDVVGTSAPSVTAMYANNPVLFAPVAAILLFKCWQGYLWTFTVRHVYGIPTRRAAITVAVPLVLSMLWSTMGFLPA